MKEKISLTDKVVSTIANEGFLRSFVDYGSTQTDSPKKFLLMSGLIALSGAIGNKLWVRTWGQRIFPNLWILLIAPSGVYRKNTAIDLGLNLLRQATKGRITPADFTREAWLSGLEANPSQVMVSKEFSELLTKLTRDYMAGTKETLTDFFTSTPVYERITKGGGLVTISWPCISLIGGSSLSWLQERLKLSDFSGGFLARFLFITATTKERWLGIRQFKEADTEKDLIDFLKEIDNLEAKEISIEDIEGEYDLWLKGYEGKILEGEIPFGFEGFASRMGGYCLKLSLLIEISKNKNAQSISPESLDKAKLILAYIEGELEQLIEMGLTSDKVGRDIDRLKSIIYSNPGITRSDALRKMNCKARYFNELISTLLERQDVFPKNIKTEGRGKVVYYPKDNE